MKLYLIMVIVCCLNLAASESTADKPYHEEESRLIKEKLNGYVVEARPILKANDTVVVTIFPEIIRIEGIDEGIDTLSTSMSLAQTWNDPRLTWDPTKYGNITKVHLPLEKIWRPDIQLYNVGPENDASIDEFPVVVHSTGDVTFVPFVTFNSYCALNLKNFPFDIQVCNIDLGSWVFHEKELQIKFFGQGNKSSIDVPLFKNQDENAKYVQHPSWTLIDNKAIGTIKANKYDCCEEQYLVLQIVMKLQRSSQFYQYVIVGPGVILALLVPIQFLLPPSSAQRSLFGVILILTTTILVTSMSRYFPFEHSSVPRIGVFFIVTMSFAAMAVFLSTLIVSVASKGKHRRAMPAWLSQVCLGSKGLRRFLCITGTSPVNSMYSSVNSRLLEDMQEPAIELLPEPDMDQAPGGKEMYNSTTEAYLRSIAKSTKITAGKTVAEETFEKLNVEWQDLAKVLDRLCFIAFFILYLISVISLVSKKDEVP